MSFNISRNETEFRSINHPVSNHFDKFHGKWIEIPLNVVRATDFSGASGLKTGCRSYVCFATSIFSRCLSRCLSPVSFLFLRLPSLIVSFFVLNPLYIPSSLCSSLSSKRRYERDSRYRHWRTRDRFSFFTSFSVAVQDVSLGDSCRITRLMLSSYPTRDSFAGKNDLLYVIPL